MSRHLRSVTFLTIVILVSVIVAVTASRFGWGQLSSVGAVAVSDTQAPLVGVNTGLVTGGVVTVNGSEADKFDVSAGSGYILDWTDPTAPVRTLITWEASTAVAVTGILTDTFTALSIDSDGLIVQHPGEFITPAENRSDISIQGITHIDNATIGSVGSGSTPAYEQLAGALDYIRFLGIATRDNNYTFASTNLTLKKVAGSSALPFINRSNDLQSPTIEINAEQDPVASIIYSHENAGATGFVSTFETVIDPDGYSPSGSEIIAVTTNRWTIQRINFFPQTNITVIEYGQFQYTSLASAIAAFALEEHVDNPGLVVGKLLTVLFVNEGADNLSDIADALFQQQ